MFCIISLQLYFSLRDCAQLKGAYPGPLQIIAKNAKLKQKKKKEGMERQMAQLEEDIKTFSRQNVYVTEY